MAKRKFMRCRVRSAYRHRQHDIARRRTHTQRKTARAADAPHDDMMSFPSVRDVEVRNVTGRKGVASKQTEHRGNLIQRRRESPVTRCNDQQGDLILDSGMPEAAKPIPETGGSAGDRNRAWRTSPFDSPAGFSANAVDHFPAANLTTLPPAGARSRARSSCSIVAMKSPIRGAISDLKREPLKTP